MQTFLKWVRGSLRGHIVFYQILAVPIVAYIWSRGYALGMLTPAWAVFAAFISSIGFLIIATLTWYTLTLRWKRRDGE